MSAVRIGVIGGSGLYAMDGLEVDETRVVETPFGDPSEAYVLGKVEGIPVAFLARHGKGHRLLPTEINYRANIFGFKLLGVDTLISVGAVGSMKLEYRPTDIVVPHQFYDRTRKRPDTFFGDGLVAHVSMAQPICLELATLFSAAANAAGARVHEGGTYLCMEGPQFSTRAESEIYRQWNVDVIGMTNAQEAKLAKEAEIAFATLAMVTDYDCWHEEEDDVTVEAVIEILSQNALTAQDVVRRIVCQLGELGEWDWPAHHALANALITEPSSVPEETRSKLAPLVAKYLGA